jgi:hypothetical protein
MSLNTFQLIWLFRGGGRGEEAEWRINIFCKYGTFVTLKSVYSTFQHILFFIQKV